MYQTNIKHLKLQNYIITHTHTYIYEEKKVRFNCYFINLFEYILQIIQFQILLFCSFHNFTHTKRILIK